MQKDIKSIVTHAVFSVGLGLSVALAPNHAFSFTQGAEHVGELVPQGHEWITRLAAIEVLGGERALKTDPADPRIKWPASARAANTSLAGAEEVVREIKSQLIPANSDLPYAATYMPVLDAILGERWVDIGGVDFAEVKLWDRTNCLDMVTQEAPDIQYDHFMRKPSDIGGQGGVDAARESSQRFINYFVNAAMAADGQMTIWDGGGSSAKRTADRHYFLFGRALHLFEDSFSPDHTVREASDFFRKVRQVKSYLCAAGSEQHAHLEPPHSKFYETGDVIWISMKGKIGINDWSSYNPSNIRPYALAAIEGSKDVWAAFIRTMAMPRETRLQFAKAEAEKLVARWLSFDESPMRDWYKSDAHRGSTYVKATPQEPGKGTSVDGCMARDWRSKTQAEKLKDFEDGRLLCLYNMIPATEEAETDPSLHLTYNWKWRNKAYLEAPPGGWNFQKPPAPVQVAVRIANRVNNQWMRLEGDQIYNDAPNTDEKRKNIAVFNVSLQPGIPLSQNLVTFSLAGQTNQFLNYAATSWGKLSIWGTADKGQFVIERRADGYYNIKNTNWNQYIYMYTDERTYLNQDGKAENKNAQWIIKGLPETR